MKSFSAGVCLKMSAEMRSIQVCLLPFKRREYTDICEIHACSLRLSCVLPVYYLCTTCVLPSIVTLEDYASRHELSEVLTNSMHVSRI